MEKRLANLEIQEVKNGWIVSEPETEYEIDLLGRTFECSILALETLQTVGRGKEKDVVRDQLARSATSIGANYEEAQGASSKKDFSNKIRIVYREVRESHYWCRMLHRMNWGDAGKVEQLLAELGEQKRIFGRMLQTLAKEK